MALRMEPITEEGMTEAEENKFSFFRSETSDSRRAGHVRWCDGDGSAAVIRTEEDGMYEPVIQIHVEEGFDEYIDWILGTLRYI
jgi:hypothetical protein